VPAGEVSAKHSRGGVVDIEYWVQARQIECGATDPAVRTPNTLHALERLTAGGHVAPAHATEIAEAYAFLRRLIDALRVVRGNARDLTIPHADSKAFAYLARRLELEPEALREAITRHMGCAATLWPAEA
jgi:glutamate-ammonia-ligase adenylyltransferase